MARVRQPTIEVRTRHLADCAEKRRGGPAHRDCACPKWLYFPDERRYVSTGTHEWAKAELQRQAILDSYSPKKRAQAESRAEEDAKAVIKSEIQRVRKALSRMRKLPVPERPD